MNQSKSKPEITEETEATERGVFGPLEFAAREDTTEAQRHRVNKLRSKPEKATTFIGGSHQLPSVISVSSVISGFDFDFSLWLCASVVNGELL